MKKLFLLLFPYVMFGQVQIGNDIDGFTSGDESGRGVSISTDGTILAVGSALNDGNGVDSGHVRIFEIVNGIWEQIGDDINGEAPGDESGRRVSLSSDGTIVAIGAPRNGGNGVESGQVRVFENVGGVWTQIGADIDGEGPNDILAADGLSMSGDGRFVAAGAIGNDGNGASSGHVRVYENIGGTWTQVGQDIDGENAGDLSGVSVSLSNDGSVVAIGAVSNSDAGLDAGHVRIYEYVGDTWEQIGNDIDGKVERGFFGLDVSLSGDGSIIAIGAPSNDPVNLNAGYTGVYENIGGVWTQIGIDIIGSSSEDFSGTAVRLSNDGNFLAVGSPNNDDNGQEAGNVRLFQNVNGNWSGFSDFIFGESAGDESGRNISLSGDGKTIAIGAAENSGNGVQAGHVRVYDLSEFLGVDIANLIDVDVKIYPNPTSTTMNLEIESSLEIQDLRIYNSLGQLVNTYTKTDALSYDVSNLAKGIYFVKIQANKGTLTKELIIK